MKFNTALSVSGITLLYIAGPPSNILQEVMILIVSNSECANVNEGVTSITSNMICGEGKSICPPQLKLIHYYCFLIHLICKGKHGFGTMDRNHKEPHSIQQTCFGL
ncbi:chymotrypsin-like protease CTRL-1 [Labeo rohita]|uniref:Chymotrypsin-like protease CTRL-1 n=1 Tax=Labeo rohita TaxID=84645 RepID=A0A498MD71_LABRO|nr:chymotrypsin-like protease CTRL-1 [Labeo rohita]